MEQDLHLTNHEVSLLGISLYALGFGIPPLILAPFSEVCKGMHCEAMMSSERSAPEDNC